MFGDYLNLKNIYTYILSVATSNLSILKVSKMPTLCFSKKKTRIVLWIFQTCSWESPRFSCNPVCGFVYRMKLGGRACDGTVYLRLNSAGDDTCTWAINHALNEVCNNTFTERPWVWISTCIGRTVSNLLTFEEMTRNNTQ